MFNFTRDQENINYNNEAVFLSQDYQRFKRFLERTQEMGYFPTSLMGG